MEEFISKLRENKVFVSLNDDNLNVNFNGNGLPNEILVELKKNKKELIAYLKDKINKSKFQEIVPIAGANYFELSSAQKRLWILCQFEEASVAYNLPGQLEGNFDKFLIEKAFNSLIERHEILRTVFREDENGDIKQYINSIENSRFQLGYHDLQNVGNTEEEINMKLNEELVAPFDLENGPLIRAKLFQTREDNCILAFSMHHIISDGWSLVVLINELLTFYNGLKDQHAVLKPLRIQYKDYAAWQLGELSRERLKKHKEFWLNQFVGDIPVLEIGTDKPRPPVKTFNGGAVRKLLSSELLDKLNEIVKEQKGTLFMGLLGLVNTLLYKYTGQHDIIIGTPAAGRGHVDLEKQIGYYVNTIAIRTQFTPEDGYKKLLDTIIPVTLGAYEHQIYPFDELIDTLNLQRDMSRNALFDVVVVLQNAGVNDLIEGGLGGFKERYRNDEDHVVSKFDLTFNFTEAADGLKIHIEYNSDLYNRDTIVRMGEHLEAILDQLVDKPELPLNELELITFNEKHRILVEFNDTQVDYPKDKTIIDLFEEQVKKTPSRIAVVFQDKELTYKELNEKSNQLAHYLQKNYSIQPDDLVGIKLDRSELMIISIFGVLKSGGAYVPIDPEYPQERIDYMIEDSACVLLLDENEIAKFKSSEKKFSKENLLTVISPNSLAYVIYTSGTTGQPKGTLVEHRNVVRLFKTEKPQFDFNEKDVWTMFHSYCFDFSVWEMYGAILNGGKLVIITSEVAKDPKAYLEILVGEEVTVLNQTPSAFYNLIKEEIERKENLLQLRYIIFGGEALYPGKLKAWKEKYPKTKLINMYGITETTVHVTYKEITDDEILNNVSNIGKPIPTLSCYVLDHYQKLLPIGVSGELYVGGEGVARGYLNRPDLTKVRFVENPFGLGGRLYRSGDKVKLLENGDMEYQGRMDDQVKIRGYRIELAEIENTLRRNDLITEAVVLAVENESYDKSLVAYLQSKEELNTAELRSFLKEQLPEYMIPSYFIQIEQIPLTANGKVDKKALPNPDGMGMSTGVEYIAPENDIEQKLVEIWSEVLKLEKGIIGVNNNFFELGGNSTKAITLTRLINKCFSTEERITIVFNFPTINDQANYLQGGLEDDQSFEGTTAESVETMDDMLNLLNEIEEDH